MGSGAGEVNRVTESIIAAAIEVRKHLGLGFLEKVYENALLHELRSRGLFVEPQKALKVLYKGVVVGDYIADLLVEGQVIIELKAAQAIAPEHVAQALNYMKATGLPLCLIINFGPERMDYKRLVGPTYRNSPTP